MKAVLLKSFNVFMSRQIDISNLKLIEKNIEKV